MGRIWVNVILMLLLASCGGVATNPKANLSPSNISISATPNSNSIQPTFFGFDIHSIGAGTPWPSVPFGTWGLWDARVQWPDLEPAPGTWDFSRLDMYVNEAQQHGVGLIYTLGMTPRWASARPDEACPYGLGEAAEPADFQTWRDYVTRLATRYKGKIQYYILWNEPGLPYFFTGSMQTLLELSKEAYSIIKTVDPSATVLSPAGFRMSGTGSFLSLGGGQYFDVLAVHLYTYPNPPEYAISEIQTISETLQQYGLSNKPIWNTEIGWYRDPLSDRDAVAYVSRSMILNAANAMGRFVWYAWDDHGWSKIWMTQTDNTTLTPSGVAFREVEQWLTFRNVQCDSSALSSGQLWTCALTSPDGFNGHIVWTTTGESNFDIPTSWSATTSRTPDGASALLNGSNTYTVGPIPVLFDNAQP